MKKRKILKAALIGLLSSIVLTIVSQLGYFDFVQRQSIDLMIWWRDEGKPSDIVIVAIDKETFEYLENKSPLPRDKVAALLDFLIKCGPNVISIDVEFRDKTTLENDKLLAKTLDMRKIIIPFSIEPSEVEGRYHRFPLYYKPMDTETGYANVYADNDGVIRKTPIFLRDENGGLMKSFGLQTYSKYSGKNDYPEDIYGYREIRINYSGPAGTFQHYPAISLIRLAELNVSPPEDNPFRGKIVLIGATFEDSRDLFYTPQGRMSGVEIHANIVNTLLTKKEIKTLKWPLEFLILLILCMTISMIFALFRQWKAIVINVTSIVLVFIPLSYAAYTMGNYWIDFILPFLAVVSMSVTNSYIEKKRIRSSFSQYVSADVVDKIYEDESLLLGTRRIVTVLFSDLRGFTTISERLPVVDIAQILNEYFGSMVDAIHENGGMINKFIGDAIMAIYNAPVDNASHAKAAVKTAVNMQEELFQLNRGWAEKGYPELYMRIGVHTGDVFAGNIGSRERKEYTVIGDTVNIASRLENLNKELSTSILISEDTYRLVENYVDVVDKGIVSIKGKENLMRVYELNGIKESSDSF